MVLRPCTWPPVFIKVYKSKNIKRLLVLQHLRSCDILVLNLFLYCLFPVPEREWRNTTHCVVVDCWAPHHADGEVVVDDAVGDGVALLLLVVGDDVDVPAVQRHLGAVFDVPEELQQAAALVTFINNKMKFH